MNQDPRGKTFLIIGSVLCGVTGLFGCGAAMLSPMLFDAPHSEEKPAIRLVFLSILTYPIVCIVAVVAAWILYAVGKRTAAQTTIFLPLLNWLGFGAACLWW